MTVTPHRNYSIVKVIGSILYNDRIHHKHRRTNFCNPAGSVFSLSSDMVLLLHLNIAIVPGLNLNKSLERYNCRPTIQSRSSAIIQ